MENLEPYKSLRTVIFEVQATAKPTKPAEKKPSTQMGHKAGDTWKTASGKIGAKNKDGAVDYFEDEDSAKAWISGQFKPAGRADQPGDTSVPVELDRDGYEVQQTAGGKPANAKPAAAAATRPAPQPAGGAAPKAQATAVDTQRQAQPQGGKAGAEKATAAQPAEENPEVARQNPKTEFDAAFQVDPKATKKAKEHLDIRKANVVAKAIKEKKFAGPQQDKDSVFGDAAAERRFTEEMNHAALSAMRGEAAYDFELCSDMFAHVGFCFEGISKKPVTKGIPRDKMPQFSSQVDPSRTDSPAFKALMAGKGYTSPDQVKPEDLKAEVNMEKQFREALQAAGYEINEEEVSVTSLKPIQGQLKGEKVAGMYGTLLSAQADPDNYGKQASRLLEPIYVSDGYVIDGHHRWAAQCAMEIANGGGANTTMKTRTITKGGESVSVEEIIAFSNKFQKDIGLLSQTRGGETIPEKKPTQKEWTMSKFGSGRFGRIVQSLHESAQTRLDEGAVKAALEDWYESLPKAAVQQIHKYRKYAAGGTAGKPVLDEIADILKKNGVKPGFFGTLKKAAQHIKDMGYDDFMVPMFDLNEAAKRKFDRTPAIGTFRSGMQIDTDDPQYYAGALKSKPRKTDAAGNLLRTAKQQDKTAAGWQKTQQTVQQNIATAQDLIDTAEIKPVGTTFEIYGKKGGKEATIKVKKVMKMGDVVFMVGTTEVELYAAGTGLQVLNKKTRRALLDAGNDMIWESADFCDVGRITITEIRKLTKDELAKFDAEQRKKVMAAKDVAINKRAAQGKAAWSKMK
jgi:hypothetical protein